MPVKLTVQLLRATASGMGFLVAWVASVIGRAILSRLDVSTSTSVDLGLVQPPGDNGNRITIKLLERRPRLLQKDCPGLSNFSTARLLVISGGN